MATIDPLQALPNELLDLVLSYLSTTELLVLTTVSRYLLHQSLLTFHARLSSAATLDDHTLILECYHPSAKLVASNLYCTPLGTPSLDEPPSLSLASPVGQLSHLLSTYTSFIPQRKQPENVIAYRRKHPAGDVRGSRTYPDPASTRQSEGVQGSGMVVSETVNLDAHELFGQLCCVTNLVKHVPGRRGLFSSIVEVGDGMIRVWRDWLRKRAGKGLSAANPVDEEMAGEEGKDDGILWVNNSRKAVGIKFGVKERNLRRVDPVLYQSEDEVPVSYYVYFEELLIKTSYLLEKLERSREQQSLDLGSGKAIIFGSTLNSYR